MATVKFIIKGNSALSQIYVRVRDGRNVDISTKTQLVIDPSNWSSKKGEVKQTSTFQEKQNLQKKLNQLEILIVSTAKQILTVEDLINYTGFSRSYIYKLVHKNILPYYKPNGKTLFFQKKEIDSFLLQNKSTPKAAHLLSSLMFRPPKLK